MHIRFVIATLVITVLGLTPISGVRADGDQPACGMLPPKITESNYYAGFGSCALKQVREQALWKGLKSDKLVQQFRFTFTDGHLRWLWTIRIDERKNGKGRVEITRIGRSTNSRYRMETKRHWHRDINKKDMELFNQLTKKAEIWKFENGTWDDADELFLHCVSLGMENVTSDGFRYSHVNIGCNRPLKLEETLMHLFDISGLDWDTIYDR